MVGARPRGLKPPEGYKGKVPVGGLGDEVPEKLMQNVKLVYNF